MSKDRPGIAFEKVVAALQARIDPTSKVAHNEIIVDRLGHSRQFDVVIRGKFAGQDMLGVIECKDLKRKVGNPEVEALVTKSRDVKANFTILMSRSGFTQPALEKCTHYGIRALSLIEDDPVNKNFFIGTRWTANRTLWKQLAISLHFANPAVDLIQFAADQLKINGKRVIDGITNYLMDHEEDYVGFGWIVDLIAKFEVPQSVEVGPGVEHLCTAISFKAERVCEQLEYRAGITGEGFFNWNSKEATFAPGSQIITDPVPTDFSLWKPRADETWNQSGFIEMHLDVSSAFTRVDDALDLNAL